MHKLDFYTAYNQFYICDATYSGDTGSVNFWSERAFLDRLAIEDGILGIGIGSYGHVKAELQLLPGPNPNSDYSVYDHVVEGGLKIESGVLQVIDCPNSEVQISISVDSGNYRARIYSSGLFEFVTDEDEGDDSYKIEIWPDDNLQRTVLKRNSNKT